MKKLQGKRVHAEAEMRPEYDFSAGVRGKYAKQYAAGTNIIILEPEIAAVFPDSRSVNEALRTLVRIMRRQPKKAVP